MIGVHEFKITAQTAPENPGLLIIDVHHRWGNGQDSREQHTSWMGEAKEKDVLDCIVESIKAAYEQT